MGVFNLRRNILPIFAIVSLIVGSVGLAAVGTASPAPPVIRVEPKDNTAEVGETFTINVTIADVTVENSGNGIYAWECGIRFNDYIKTDTWPGDGVTKSFVTTEKPVLYDSEEVYVNGILMNKTEPPKPGDYTISYGTGNITFTTAPGLGAEIEAIYLFKPPILQVVSVMEGPFLKDTGYPTAWNMAPPQIDNYTGTIAAGNALWGYPEESQGAIGSGVLCNITFQVRDIGRTTPTVLPGGSLQERTLYI